MRKIINKKTLSDAFILLFCFVVIATAILISPPKGHNELSVVEIKEGDNLSNIAEKLHTEGIIRSPFWFRAFVILLEGEHQIPAGEYYFDKSEPVYSVARKVSEGSYGMEPLKITIIEGWNLERIADHLEKELPMFDKDVFFAEANEGYLAPDTYNFFPSSSTEDVVKKMENNFEDRMDKIQEDMEMERPLDEIIIMASILEAEANTKESKRKIADILWRRLEDGMPLQVDAAFKYVNNKTTYDLTLEDLEIEDPYNTYRFSGLPPTPITNPSEESIRAAIDPIENEYWYFLSDLAGNMYYAEDFDGHQYNRENYLRK